MSERDDTELLHVETDRVRLTLSRAGPAREALGEVPDQPRTGRLVIEPRRSGMVFHAKRWQRAYEGAPAPRLFEDTEYRLYVRALGDHAVSVEHPDPELLGRLSVEEGARVLYGPLDFGSRPGLTRLTLRVDDQPEFDIEVEVFPSRLDYREGYHRLLGEVQEVLTGLALDYLRATFLAGAAVRVPRASSLEWLTLLSRVAADLEGALQHVAAHPIRGLTRVPVTTTVDRVRRVDARLRAAIRRGAGAGGWRLLEGGTAVRERLREWRARPTLDTPEHRWLAQQLREIRRRLGELRQSEGAGVEDPRRDRIQRQLRHLSRRVARLEGLEPLAAARGSPPASFASLQLLGAPGYREAYRALMVLSLGLRIDGGPWSLSVKDLHLLYRYWCFLSLVRLLSERTGLPAPASSMFRVERNGLRVVLARGNPSQVVFPFDGGSRVTVTFAPELEASPLAPALLPDLLLTLEVPGRPIRRVALDAPYALDASEAYRRVHGHAGPPTAQLARLHVYRDGVAVPGAGARGLEEAVSLYPARRAELPEVRQGSLWRSLVEEGVGALPALPGDLEALAEWLDALLLEHLSGGDLSASSGSDSPRARRPDGAPPRVR